MKDHAEMHILLAHNDYQRFSGEEAAVENIAALLRSHGHRISWLRRSSAGIENTLSAKVNAFFSGIYSSQSKKDMQALIASDAIELVQVQNLYPLLSASILPPCRKAGIPVLMRCPNYRLFCPNGLHFSHGRVCERCLRGAREWNCIFNNCEEALVKSIGYAARGAFGRLTSMIKDNVSMFIVLSHFQKERFATAGLPPERIAVLPNTYRVANTVSGCTGGDSVAFSGRLSREKGIGEFLAAARMLPHVKFRVAGSTAERPAIAAEAPSNVEFLGFLTGSALTNFYNQSRVFVSPNQWYEGFPNTIVEAMAYGLPVVATRMGAIPEIVNDGETGLLSSPGDVEDLAEKIEYLWKDPELCRMMGQAGRSKVMTEYCHERWYQRWLDIVEQAKRVAAAC